MLINAGQLNENLDRAIMTMKKGEEAIVTINSDSMFYEIKLVDFNKVFLFLNKELILVSELSN